MWEIIDMNKKACSKCGLIQSFDELFGLIICDYKESFLFGCPNKEEVLKILPRSQYDERIKRRHIICKPIEMTKE